MLLRLMVLAIAVSFTGPALAKCNNTLLPGCGSGPKLNSTLKNIPSQVPRAPTRNVPKAPGKKNPSALSPKAPQAQTQPKVIPGAPQNRTAGRPQLPATNVAQGSNVLFKHVCQASQTWCYLNSTTQIEQGKTCHCRGDIGKIK